MRSKSGNLNAEDRKILTPHFLHPFTMTVSGSTGSGKSEWIQRMLGALGSGLIEPTPVGVVYCYGELNEKMVHMQQQQHCPHSGSSIWLRMHHGCPSTEEQIQQWATQANRRLLLVLDDLIGGVNNGTLRTTFLDTLFTRGSHNWGVSVVLVTQHLFTGELRIPRNNSHYIVLMRNPAGALQVRNLATQLFPSQSAFFLEAYGDATRGRYSYLLIDMHPSTEESQGRLKTHIYPEEAEFPIVYIPKGSESAIQTSTEGNA